MPCCAVVPDGVVQTGDVVWWVEGTSLPNDPDVIEMEKYEKMRAEARRKCGGRPGLLHVTVWDELSHALARSTGFVCVCRVRVCMLVCVFESCAQRRTR